VGVLERVGADVAIEKRERRDQRRIVAAEQCGEGLERRGAAGDPRQHRGAGVILLLVEIRRVVLERVTVVVVGDDVVGRRVDLEDPGIEPAAALDRVPQLVGAAMDERVQPARVEAARQRTTVDVGHERQPARGRDRLGLDEDAAEEPVDRRDVERLERRRHAVEQRLQLGDLALAERRWRRLAAALRASRRRRFRALARRHHSTSCVQRKSAMRRPSPPKTTHDHTCVVRPRCSARHSVRIVPSRTVPRKLLFSSIVVKFFAPSGRCAKLA
jgi:hypothetical protein